jgi:hypothetical protein
VNYFTKITTLFIYLRIIITSFRCNFYGIWCERAYCEVVRLHYKQKTSYRRQANEKELFDSYRKEKLQGFFFINVSVLVDKENVQRLREIQIRSYRIGRQLSHQKCTKAPSKIRKQGPWPPCTATPQGKRFPRVIN